MTLSPTSETAFKEKVMRDLKKLPHCYALKTQERGRHGVPDLLICLRGHFIAIELKTDKGVASKLQLFTMAKIREAGGIAFISSPATWRVQMDILKGFEA